MSAPPHHEMSHVTGDQGPRPPPRSKGYNPGHEETPPPPPINPGYHQPPPPNQAYSAGGAATTISVPINNPLFDKYPVTLTCKHCGSNVRNQEIFEKF